MVREPGLDFLRALAILWVLLFHAITEGIGNPLPAVGGLGWMGVDLFFVLSGYLIGSQLFKSYAAHQIPDLRSFYLRRAFRILPAFWFVVGLYSCFPRLHEAAGMQPLWQFYTFTENFLVDYQHNQTFSHAWSLCVEEHFYLLFPLLAGALLIRPSQKVVLICGGVIVIAGMFLRSELWLNYVSVPSANRSAYLEWIYYPTFSRVDGLFAGVVLAALRWFRPALWARMMRQPYALLAVGLIALSVAIVVAKNRTTYTSSVYGFPALAWSFALIVAACASPRGFFGRTRIPGAQFLATITFSLYLIHKLTWHALKIYGPESARVPGWKSFCLCAVSALIAGTLLYGLIERPFLRLRYLLENRRREKLRFHQRPAEFRA